MIVITEFSIFGEIRRNINKTFTLDLLRADFGLLGRLTQEVPWEAALEIKGAQERWACFKAEILRAQAQTVPVRPKRSQRGKRPAWMGNKVLKAFRNKRRMYQLWKEGQGSQEVFKGFARVCRKKLGRPKLSLNLIWQLL